METENLHLASISTTGGESNKSLARGDVPKIQLSEAEIQAWIVSYLAELLEVDQDEIDVDIAFDRYGLDSAAAVALTGNLEDWMERELDPTLLYDYPTVEALSRHLAETKSA